MSNSSRKTTTVLAALALSLGVLGAAAPSYADNNGSLASPAFPSDGIVRLGLAASDQSYSAYYPSNSGHSANSASTGLDWNQIDGRSNSRN
jgi:hypothetical protein